MNRGEAQKLLGGYATGTLTAEERQALFAAALEDQQLFDELAREQSLRDLLSDPASRTHLLAALDVPAPAALSWFGRWWKPLSMGAAAAVLASVTVVAVMHRSPNVPPAMVAKLAPQPVSPVTSPPAAPAPVATETGALRQANRALNTDQAAMVRERKVMPSAQGRVAPPPAPAALPEAPKAAAPAFDVNGAGLQRAELDQAKSAAPPSPPPGLQAFPATPRDAITTGFLAGNAPAPTDARALFSGAGPAGVLGGIISTQAGGRGGGGGRGREAAIATPAAARNLGLQYRVLGPAPAGDFVETDAAETGAVDAGVPFKLQFTANDNGYMRILQLGSDGDYHSILSAAVSRMQAFETGAIRVDEPGRVKFFVTFALEPLPPSNVAQPDDDIVVDRGRLVTVADRNAAVPHLSFNLMFTVQ